MLSKPAINPVMEKGSAEILVNLFINCFFITRNHRCGQYENIPLLDLKLV